MTGILKIINTNNGRVFCKVSNDINSTLTNELNKLRQSIHPNKQLQEDYNKFGEYGLTFLKEQYISLEGAEVAVDYYLKTNKKNYNESGNI